MRNGSLCTGHALGKIFERGFRWLSGISLEMRRKWDVSVDYI